LEESINIKKTIYFILGCITFILGILGVYLPLLPGTPLLLLAAFFFSQSHPKIHQWMLKLPLVGDLIHDWQKEKSIKLKTKIWASIYLWLALSFSIFKLKDRFPLVLLLFTIGSLVSIFLWTRKTKRAIL